MYHQLVLKLHQMLVQRPLWQAVVLSRECNQSAVHAANYAPTSLVGSRLTSTVNQAEGIVRSKPRLSLLGRLRDLGYVSGPRKHRNGCSPFKRSWDGGEGLHKLPANITSDVRKLADE